MLQTLGNSWTAGILASKGRAWDRLSFQSILELLRCCFKIIANHWTAGSYSNLWREITPIPPCNYSSACWKHLGIRGRQAYRQVRDVHATDNYSNPFWNYSDVASKSLGIIGREKKREAHPVHPAFEIYYYSIAGKAEMKLLQSMLMLTRRNLWRGGGGSCPESLRKGHDGREERNAAGRANTAIK